MKCGGKYTVDSLCVSFLEVPYNISCGIAFGLMTYIAIKLLTGRPKKIGSGAWIIALLFIAMFSLTH